MTELEAQQRFIFLFCQTHKQSCDFIGPAPASLASSKSHLCKASSISGGSSTSEFSAEAKQINFNQQDAEADSAFRICCLVLVLREVTPVTVCACCIKHVHSWRGISSSASHGFHILKHPWFMAFHTQYDLQLQVIVFCVRARALQSSLLPDFHTESASLFAVW